MFPYLYRFRYIFLSQHADSDFHFYLSILQTICSPWACSCHSSHVPSVCCTPPHTRPSLSPWTPPPPPPRATRVCCPAPHHPPCRGGNPQTRAGGPRIQACHLICTRLACGNQEEEVLYEEIVRRGFHSMYAYFYLSLCLTS